MNIDNQMMLPMSPAAAWALLMQIPATAACFPGASDIVEVDASHFTGKVTVKLGPLTMLFNGRIHIQERDDDKYQATIQAQWSEAKGRGNANTITKFHLQDQNQSTQVIIHSDIQLAGQIAQYGRGVGMINSISEQLIRSFASNIAAHMNDPELAQSNTAISGIGLMAKVIGQQLRRWNHLQT